MPKEKTLANDYGQHGEHRHIEVRWVRKGSASHDSGLIEVATVNNLEPSMDDRVEGVFLTLDRNSINRLVRTLRKARDQAFGADA